MKKSLFLCLALGLLAYLQVPTLNAQCTALETAIPGLTLNASASGTNNRSGMVYNPNSNLYYSVNAGSSGYPADVYDSIGTLLTSPVQGFDYRGAWWNPTAGQFEGNGYNALGIFVQTLEAGTGYPTGTGTTIFTANQPAAQSVGELDYDSNEIIYYNDGFIHRYDRADNSFLGQYLISGLPVTLSDINNNSVVYTGCPGREIGIYDFTNQRLLFINKADGSYNGSCQLPGSAPQRSSFGMSYANNLFWLFDGGIWFSYQVVSFWPTPVETDFESVVKVYPNPTQDKLQIEISPEYAPYELVLSDLQGRVIRRKSELTTSLSDWDLSALPPATYLLRIISDKGVVHQKILKNR